MGLSITDRRHKLRLELFKIPKLPIINISITSRFLCHKTDKEKAKKRKKKKKALREKPRKDVH